MRVIKLSSADPHMKTREAMTIFFSETLERREPKGQFFVTAGRLSENGIFPGERLLFTYDSQCVYEARSVTGRVHNENSNDDDYPFYFCVDVDSIAAVSGTLKAFEQKLIQEGLHNGKNIAASQAWSRIEETGAFQSHIGGILDEIRQGKQL